MGATLLANGGGDAGEAPPDLETEEGRLEYALQVPPPLNLTRTARRARRRGEELLPPCSKCRTAASECRCSARLITAAVAPRPPPPSFTPFTPFCPLF